MSSGASNPSSSKGNTTGVVQIVVGIGLGLFAYAHRPVEGFIDAMQRADSWAFKPSIYYGILFIAALLALAGVLRLTQGKKAPNIGKILSGEGSGLDRIKKAKELLDSGAIDAMRLKIVGLLQPGRCVTDADTGLLDTENQQMARPVRVLAEPEMPSEPPAVAADAIDAGAQRIRRVVENYQPPFKEIELAKLLGIAVDDARQLAINELLRRHEENVRAKEADRGGTHQDNQGGSRWPSGEPRCGWHIETSDPRGRATVRSACFIVSMAYLTFTRCTQNTKSQSRSRPA